MVQAFDHRASGVTTVDANLHRGGQGAAITDEQRHDPSHVIAPRYFILDPGDLRVELAIKDVTSTTNTRSLISCIIPAFGAGHTLPILRVEMQDPTGTCRGAGHVGRVPEQHDGRFHRQNENPEQPCELVHP